MKKHLKLLLILCLGFLAQGKLTAQNPGLVISEAFVNPSGTDSCKEFVELVATAAINFSSTPYTVIVANNGTATVRGWKEGKAITYAFEINSGSVKSGDVVYVGGSCMKINGLKIKTINNMTTGGDGGIGNINSTGVFGNGGTSADAVAVFAKSISNIDSTTVPVDAIFYGTAFGTAINAAGAAGYQLPVNDLYNGGKLSSTSYLTGDPGANYIVATGKFNTVSNSFKTARTHSVTSTTASDGTTSITFEGAADTTSPVATFVPQNNDTTVFTTSNLKISFSEKAFLPGSVSLNQTNIDTCVFLRLATGTNVSFDASVLNNVITLTPTIELSKNTAYTFGIISGKLADSVGNKITTNLSVNFKTLPEQTAFKPADISVIAYRMNALTTDDEFDFVTFVDILPFTRIQFTDAKFTTNSPAQCTGGLTWIAPASGVAAGSIIQIKNDLPSTNIGTVTGAKFGLSSGGDQVIAYTGTNTNPNFITAFSSNNWLTSNTLCSGSTSMLPSTLSNAVNAIQHSGTKGNVSGNTANAYYTGPTTGTVAQLKLLIHDTVNWNGSASGTAAQTFPNWIFPGSPTVVKAEVLSAKSIRVIFSRDMDSARVTSLSSYTGISGLNSISVTKNGSLADSVTLNYSTAFQNNTAYSLTVSNVIDKENRKLFTPYIFKFTFSTTLAFDTRFVTVTEGTKTVSVTLTPKFASSGSFTLEAMPNSWNTASSNDINLSTSSFNFNETTSKITVNFNINDDSEIEQDEYFVVGIKNINGFTITGNDFFTVYIKDNDRLAPTPSKSIELVHLNSFDPNPAAGSTCEISAYDSASKRLFMTSAIQKRMDIADMSNPSNISLVKSIDMVPYGGITSIAIKNGIVAVASPDSIEQNPGKVIFFNTNGDFISKVTVGALPDHVGFSPNGKFVVTADEGQPNLSYTNDPEGSVTMIDISGGVQNLTQSNVTVIDFKGFNANENTLIASGVRKLFKASTLSQDFEPEYITISADNKTGWVSLQENNAIAVIDFATKKATNIWALGTKEFKTLGNGFDASDKSGSVLISNWNVKAFTTPDQIATYSVNNKSYLVTANEGDEKEYTPLNERTTVNAIILDSATFPNRKMLMEDHSLGRLRITNLHGDNDADGDYDELYMVGPRSFSIYDLTSNSMVYNSGDAFELITSQHPSMGRIFNADNEASNTLKSRSRSKGPEPEGVTVATIADRTFAFITLERIGGVMIYDITNPSAPVYVDYKNTRSNTVFGGDNGPEGIVYIQANQSPTGKPMIVVSNEISGTVTLFEVRNNIPSSVNNLPKTSSNFVAYPNPTQGLINTSIIGNYSIYNNLGQMVLQMKNTNQIDISSLNRGIYYIQNDFKQTHKIILQK
jgi:hypothetical protein